MSDLTRAGVENFRVMSALRAFTSDLSINEFLPLANAPSLR
jgi:hypothetical protein